jgi:5-methylcytosine-specific restriction endonuclease McrA
MDRNNYQDYAAASKLDLWKLLWEKQDEIERLQIEISEITTPTGKPKRKRLSEVIKNYVKDRDDNKCISCGSGEPLDVHHIVARKHSGTDDPRNLETLCRDCHAEKHGGKLAAFMVTGQRG